MTDSRPRGSLLRPRSRTADHEGPRARVRQLLPYVLANRPLLVVVLALSLLGAVASLAQPLLVANLITAVQSGSPMTWLVVALVALVVIAALLSGFEHYLLQRMGETVVLGTRTRLLRSLLRLPISQFDARRTGDLVSRVGSDATLLRAVLTQGTVEAVGGALTFVGALVAMAILDIVLLAFTVGVIALALITVVSQAGLIRRASAAAQRKVGDLTAAVERAIGGIRTIRATNATERETELLEREAVGAYDAGVRVAKVSALIVPVAGIALQVSLLVVLGVGGFRVAAGELSVANLVAFILFLFMLIMPLGQTFGAITSVSTALGALGRIQEIIDLPAEEEGPASSPAPTPSAPAIEFDQVSFQYPDVALQARADDAGDTDAVPRDRLVLNQVSFSVPRGAKVALVGPSGAGKSTVLALMERFYDPIAGTIRYGGVDATALGRSAIRRQLGYVEQDAPVLAGSLADNLRLAAPDATDEECRQVLSAVNLDAVATRDPAGIDAPVGEDGVMLSGGERQRLAIARTLLGGAPILLLDESTSSLDGRNEQLLRDAIDQAAAERTLVVIAHRLSTVIDADVILVLDEGRLIGTGSHAELVETLPLYRDLAQHQLLA